MSTQTTPSLPLRPAARSLCWEHLTPPTQKAVAAVLRRLDAAVEITKTSVPKGKENQDPGSASRSSDVTTNLLVTGQRGSGKTTVLLSARFAAENPQAFFPAKTQGEELDLQNMAEKIQQHLVWLDVLDLEPLPAEANLLATLLVRVRGALDSQSTRQNEPASLYEQRPDDCWNKIEKLTRNATLMWEKVEAKDSNDRANQQIKAAEIYASFRKEFSDTMANVCKLLGAPHFGSREDGKVILVLPIDNVDRSSSHLQAIMKLSQLVACRQLILIFAAGRDDFQILLERAFHQEDSNKHATARPTCHGEDETLAIVRRQAAATQRQILPPTQQIYIQALTPEQALQFQIDPRASKTEILKELLQEPSIGIPPNIKITPNLKDPDWIPQKLLDLMQTPDDLQLNEAGRHALALPARNLVDFCLVAARQKPAKSEEHQEEKAVRIATRMLRDAIDESKLPSWAVRLLKDKIIQEDPHNRGLVTLVLTDNPIQSIKSVSSVASHNVESKDTDNDKDLPPIYRAAIELYKFCGYSLSITKPISRLEDRVSAELPTEVEGWLMLLYDLLYLTPGPRIINEQLKPDQQNLGILSTSLTVGISSAIVELRLPWRIPLWPTFFERQMFLSRWNYIISKDTNATQDSTWNNTVNGLKDALGKAMEPPGNTDSLRSLLCLAWVHTICSFGRKTSGLQEPIPFENLTDTGDQTFQSNIKAAIGEAAKLYGDICGRNLERYGDPELKRWLEVDLWLLLCSQLLGSKPEALVDGKLAKYWRENTAYLKKHWFLLIRSALADSEWYQEHSESGAEKKKLLTDTTAQLVEALEPLVSGAEHGSTES